MRGRSVTGIATSRRLLRGKIETHINLHEKSGKHALSSHGKHGPRTGAQRVCARNRCRDCAERIQENPCADNSGRIYVNLERISNDIVMTRLSHTCVVGDIDPIGLAKPASRFPRQKSRVMTKGNVSTAFATAFHNTCRINMWIGNDNFHNHALFNSKRTAHHLPLQQVKSDTSSCSGWIRYSISP
jgi:hypothetical protein